MSIKKISLSIVLILIIAVFGIVVFCVPSVKKNAETANNIGTHEAKKEQTLSVVATNFTSYDFIRAIAGDKVNLSFLLGAGKDSHSYEPTAQDMINIQKADVFIYIGGDIEKWSDKVLNSLDMNKTRSFCIADYVDKQEVQAVDGAEEESHEEHEHESHSFNEHIWTSPNNAIQMITALRDLLIELDEKNKDIYMANAEKYINEIKILQSEIREITDNRVRDRLVFGDKMPMQYFLQEFGLTASAAFSGCSSETEPSAATIAYLVDRVKEENIPVVLYIELNTGKVANVIAEEAGDGVVAMQIQTLHNVSKDDFDNGETYISLMRRNLSVLKKALQ